MPCIKARKDECPAEYRQNLIDRFEESAYNTPQWVERYRQAV